MLAAPGSPHVRHALCCWGISSSHLRWLVMLGQGDECCSLLTLVAEPASCLWSCESSRLLMAWSLFSCCWCVVAQHCGWTAETLVLCDVVGPHFVCMCLVALLSTLACELACMGACVVLQLRSLCAVLMQPPSLQLPALRADCSSGRYISSVAAGDNHIPSVLLHCSPLSAALLTAGCCLQAVVCLHSITICGQAACKCTCYSCSA